LPTTYDPQDWKEAIKVVSEWGEKISIGIIYRNDRPPVEDHFPVLGQKPLVGRGVGRVNPDGSMGILYLMPHSAPVFY